MPSRLREALLEAGRYWHSHFLKRHFTLSAFMWYGRVYRARSAKWQKRKLRTTGAVSPLVWTGQLERAVMTSAHIVARGTQARVEMEGPKWLKGFASLRGRGGTGPDMKRELRAVAPLERKKLGEIVREFVMRGAKAA
jgi:hypothetical protein